MPEGNSKTKQIYRPCLSEAGLNALRASWSAPMRALGKILEDKAIHGWYSPFEVYGFIFAIDTLRDNQPALRALLEVVDEFRIRPTFDQILDKVDQLLELKAEFKTLIQNRRRQRQTKPNIGKVGFKRGPRPVTATLEFELEDQDEAPVGHVYAARACLGAGRELNEWELGFLKGIQRHKWPSPKQKETLAEICQKCQVRWA